METLEDRHLLAFDLAVDYSAGDNPQAIVAGYFNNDVVLDLAVANYNSNNVSVLLGNPGGTFQPAQDFATGAGPRSLAVGDFNADGKLDLATANDGDVSVLLGDGLGSLGAPTSLGVAGNPASVAVGDFNGDGLLDLGVASNVYTPAHYECPYYCYWYPGYYDGYANVLLGNGAGSFSGPNVTWLGNGYHTSAAVANFNGDTSLTGNAIQDFATVNSDYGTVRVLLGDASGNLQAPRDFYAGNPYAVTAGDVNGDNKIDLVTANLYGDDVGVLLGSGIGAAWSFGASTNYFAGSQPQSVTIADLNGDLQADLVVTNPGTGTISVLLGSGTGAFKPPVNAATGAGPVAIAVGDFNGDLHPDAATANSSAGTVSVLLNDATWPALDAPSIEIADALAVTEGNTGTTSANFTVSLSAAYGQTVTVHYATADGSATLAGGDYQAASGTLIFNPGEPLTQTVTVLVNGDRNYEYSESFLLLLSDPTNAFVADATGVGAIIDDEPFISIEPYVSLAEGNTGTTPFTFIVTLSAAYDAPVTVDYATADLTPDEEYWYGPSATAGVDYAATAATLTIPAGQTSGLITVPVTGDRVGEYDELFFVRLSNPTSAQLDYYSSQAFGTIINDEPYVSIDGGGTVVEGNSGTKSVTFTVTLSAASDAPVTVSYATADGTATLAGADYQTKIDTVTFGIGQTSQTITVLVNGDRVGEYDEYFYVNLTGATGALVSNSTGYASIQDDEPRLSINSVSITEGNSGTKLMTFTVTLSAIYDQAVTVNYATHDSSATAGSDYVATSGTLTFAAGQKTKTFTVTIKGDKQKEATESFYVLLSGVSSNATVSNAYGWGTILNDEPGNGKGKPR
jgi:hypothetical protein